MMPAHRQETQVSLDPAVHTGGFAKVLTSIQGLQQRLDGFSADEADQAAATVHTLIEQLTHVQSNLKRLEELKQFVSASHALISEIPEQNFDRVDLDSLENHPQLHAIIRTSKLIRIYKAMKAAKAGAESVSFDSEVGQLQFTTPTTSDSYPPVLNPEFTRDEESPLTLPPLTLAASGSEARNAGVSLEPEPNKIREENWVFSEDTELENAEPHFIDTTIGIQAVEHRSICANPANSAEAKKRSGSEVNFDQRLLSDLIEAYGEFSLAPKSPALVEPIGSKINFSETAKDSGSELSNIHTVEAPSTSQLVPQNLAERSLLPVNTSGNNPNPLTLPEVQKSTLPVLVQPIESDRPSLLNAPLLTKPDADQPQAVQKHASLPSVTKNGELDRQLKSIIKDYGEYDLYSQQNTTSIKKAAIAAFALLGLVLCGLYFFKSNAPAVNSPARAIEPASAPSKTR